MPDTDTGPPTASDSTRSRLGAAGADPRRVADHLDGRVPDRPARLGEQRAHVREQRHTARARVLRTPGAEHRADVAEPGRRQQGVAEGVRGDVAVGVPGAAVDALPEQTGDPTGATGLDRVHIGADCRPSQQLTVSPASTSASSRSHAERTAKASG